MVKNRKCICCQEKYSYCPDCSRQDALKPSWSSQFCSEDCMTLWTTLTKYGMDRMEKSEAKEIIASLDLKPIETYAACVQRDYAKVMAPKRGKRIEIKSIDEIIETEQPIIVDESEQQEEVAEEHEVVTIENE